MSNRSWQEALREALARLRLSGRSPRIAVIGVGHVLCGDDVVGSHLACTLRSLTDGDGRLLGSPLTAAAREAAETSAKALAAIIGGAPFPSDSVPIGKEQMI